MRLALLFAERALLLVEVEIARIGDERACINLDHLANDAVQEGAVVGRHQKRAVIGLQETLQPDQAFEVEVVAGFIQQHGVGPHQQDTGQRHPHLPAPRQEADIAVHAFLAETQACEHFPGARFQRIAVQLLEPRLDLAIALDDGVQLIGQVRIDHGRFQSRHFRDELADGADAVHHSGDRALARHFADILAEIADRLARIDHNQSVVGAILAGDHAKQRCFASAIGADKANLLPLLDAHRGLDEQDLVAVLLGDIVEADHGGSANLIGRNMPALAASAQLLSAPLAKRLGSRRRKAPPNTANSIDQIGLSYITE